MDRINDLLSRLADLTDAEVVELEGLILTEFDAATQSEPTPQTVEAMVSLADALDALRAETTRRSEQQEILLKQASEATARVRGTDSPDALAEEAVTLADTASEELAENAESTEVEVPEEAEASVKDEDEEEVPAEDAMIEEIIDDATAVAEDAQVVADEAAEVEAEAEALPEEEVLPEEVVPEEEDEEDKDKMYSAEVTELETTPTINPEVDAMTASSGSDLQVPASASPIVTEERSGLQLAITAGADIPGYSANSPLPDLDAVAVAMTKRLHTLANAKTGERYNIATLSFDYPEDRRLSGDDGSNLGKINQMLAMTAAAGVCAPLETIYDIGVCGDDDRPIRDALARFNADRGGVKMFGMPTLPKGVSGVWAPDTDPTKPVNVTVFDPVTGGPALDPGHKSCGDANCPAHSEVMLEAIYACLKFNNFTNRFFPEVVKANTDLAMINHARAADLHLLAKIAAGSIAVAAVDKKVGVVRQVIFSLRNAAALLRRKHRLGQNSPMRAILPSWVLDAMIADLALQMPGDGLETLSISEARITSLLREAGINVTWSLDSWTPDGKAEKAPAGTEGFETTVGFALFPEGSWLFLDGGTLDLGVTRDSGMLSTNEYATFVETFEGVVKTGCDSLWVTTPVCVSGEASALVDVPC